MRKRDVEYKFKVGSRATLQFTVLDDVGATKNLSDTATYATGKFKVWKPDGTLIINGDITFTTRASGLVSYALTATDSVAANAGIWEGEVEIYDNGGVMSEQVETFTVTIENSY